MTHFLSCWMDRIAVLVEPCTFVHQSIGFYTNSDVTFFWHNFKPNCIVPCHMRSDKEIEERARVCWEKCVETDNLRHGIAFWRLFIA